MYKKIFLLILLLKGVFFSATSSEVANCKTSKNSNIIGEAKYLANNSRSDTVDILNYSINLSITNFTSKIISGFCTVKFRSKINGLQHVDFDLLKLTIDSVKQHDTLLTTTYNDTLLRLYLNGSMAVSDTDSVSVYYHGVPQTDATGWGGFYFTPTYAYNLGVGFGADPHVYGRVWFPCFDNFIERSTYDFTITTAAGKKAACNGVLTAHSVNANLTENWTWKLDQTIPTYLACVAIAAYKTVHQNFSGINGIIPVELQGVALDTTGIKNSFVNLQAAFNTYEQRYGAYRWDKIGYSFVPFTGGAMEHATNITYPRSFATGSLSFETIMAHELSHHWWGDLITCRTQEDMWLNEGMASFSENLFTENVYGSDQYIRDVKSNLTEIVHFTHHKEGGYQAVSGVPHSLTYSDHVYLKGKAVAHCLRGYMGDSLFFAGLQYFLNSKKFTDVSSYDFRDALETSSGLNLHAFFDNWVFSPGFSHFSVDSVRSTSLGIGYSNAISIKQKLTGAPNYFTDVPIDITLVDSSWQSETVRVMLSGKDSTFLIPTTFYPRYTALNYKQKTIDAISSEAHVLKSTGITNFSNAFMTVTVNTISDSALLRIEHNWTKPDSLKDVSKHYQLSPNRYWKVDGIIPSGLVASGKITYDGRKISFAGNSYLDHDLIVGKEDSLVLLYRANAGGDWNVYTSYTKAMGNVNDKTGTITIDSIKAGEYVLAMKNSPLSTAPVLKNENIEYKIYPNPAGNKLTIELLKNTNNNSDIDIYDSSLKLYENYRVQGEQNNLTVSSEGWPDGIYFVIITHHVTQQTIMQKIIINHRDAAND
ncbi:MAG: T9SS type A sorting domain-containing protein [Bacteroidetes bacterium]|nr:T9SS type A sorting domain-containing protein [Bacteroidota bacterium]